MLKAILKRLVAGPELDALERYRVNAEEASRFLNAFPAARDAIAYVRAMGDGTACPPITTVRAAIDADEQARLLQLSAGIRASAAPRPMPPQLQNALDDLGRRVTGWRVVSGDAAHIVPGYRCIGETDTHRYYKPS